MTAALARHADGLKTKRNRSHERRPVSLHGHIERSDGTKVDVGLLDLSYEGVGIELPVKLRVGEVIDAEVRWCKDGRAGLRFASDTPTPGDQVQRGSERAGLSVNVWVRRLGQNKYSVRTFDFSPEGCKLEVVERPRLGEQLIIKLDGLEALRAEVCWIDGFIAGVRFERPLHPAVFDLLLMRLR